MGDKVFAVVVANGTPLVFVAIGCCSARWTTLSLLYSLTGRYGLSELVQRARPVLVSSDGPECKCFDGWGSDNDVTSYRAPDCSSKTCPSGKAWAWVATSNVSSRPVLECSNQGICNHMTGLCKCMKGYNGPACERRACPNDCSGHGQCLSMKALAARTDGMPLSNPTSYQVQRNSGMVGENKAWDDDMIYGCLCESRWPVGLGSGETQESEWFGPDCSLRHCPSADDPVTTTIDETNCFNVTAAGGANVVGQVGNKCQVDCSNRGTCDYKKGECACFDTFFGHDCSLRRSEMEVEAY